MRNSIIKKLLVYLESRKEMLKSESSSSTIPVMFLTGKSDKEVIMEVLALKPAGYILKTIDRTSLLETLDKFFVQQKYKN